MQKKLICTVFIFTVVLLQLRDASAKSLVIFQDPRNFTATPTNAQAGQETTTVQVSTSNSEEATSASNVQPSESTFTEYESTQSSEELKSTKKVITPTTEEPPCWKKRKEMQAFYDMYTKLGIIIADFTLPECDEEGFYKPRQCNFDGCYCVDRAGKPTSSESGFHEFSLTCVETEATLADESLQ